MGELIQQKPVKLIASIIFKDKEVLADAEGKLKKLYGPGEELELTLPFDKTDYYYPEMGEPLERKLICFKKLVNKEKIEGIKIASNRIEDLFKNGGKRSINIDPGYVTEAKLVLLTTKDYTHRVYIGRKIFAESALFFQNETFNPWPWTYPDYASDEMVGYFNKVRALYMDQYK
ncbi:MAG: DUF4416 family protein [Candidatus Omnitrophica bacterium]|nr:DUF4416 family protein [Candidatus Omnitrophota bacterium]